MNFRIIGLVFLFVFSIANSYAQVTRDLTQPAYLAVNSTAAGGVCAAPYCVNPQLGIPLDYYSVNSQVESRLADLKRQALRGVAMSASLTTVMPASGTHNHMNISTASYGGEQAISL